MQIHSLRANKVNTTQLFDNITFAILTVLVFWGSGSVYFMQNNKLSAAVICALLGCIAVCNLFLCRYRMGMQYLKMAAVYAMIIVSLQVFWMQFNLYYIYSFFIMAPLIYIIMVCYKKRGVIGNFVETFVKISTFFAFITLFFWLLGSTFKIINPTGTLVLEWGESVRHIRTYYNIYFEPQYASVQFAGIYFGCRNSFVFPEATLCSFAFVCVSTLNELYLGNKKYRIVLALAILSTFSTAGYIYLIMLAMYFIVCVKPKNNILRFLRIVFGTVLSIVFIYLLYTIFADKLQTGSGMARSRIMSSELAAFWNSPIFGNGFEEYTNGSSDSITALLADGGIMLWGIYYFPLLYILFSRKRNLNFKILSLMFYIVFMFTVAQYSIVIFIMIITLLLYQLSPERRVQRS